MPQHPNFTTIAMDITQWYAVALGGLVVLFHVSHPLLLIMRISGTHIASSFLKHLYHPRVRLYIRGSNRYIGFSSKTARFDVLLVVLFQLLGIIIQMLMMTMEVVVVLIH